MRFNYRMQPHCLHKCDDHYRVCIVMLFVDGSMTSETGRTIQSSHRQGSMFWYDLDLDEDKYCTCSPIEAFTFVTQVRHSARTVTSITITFFRVTQLATQYFQAANR